MASALGIGAQDASAVVRSWIAVDGNWSNAANWSTGVMPQQNDEAVIAITSGFLGRAVTYDYGGPTIQLSAVRVSGGFQISNPNTVLQNSGVLLTQLQQIGLTGRSGYALTGGTNTVGGGGLHIGVDPTARGGYFLSGTGVLNSGETYVGVSGVGTFGQSGGTMTAASLTLAANAASTGVFNLNAGSATVNGWNLIGSAGAATFNHTGGTHHSSAMALGWSSGGSGTYLLNGASAVLDGDYQTVGESGAGTFVHSAGSNSARSMTIGASSGSTGIYTLGGNSTLNVSGGYQGSGVDVGSAGAGTFVQTGGTLRFVVDSISSHGLRLGTQAGGAGTYLLSGGMLDGIADATIGAGGTGFFNHTGGIHKAATVSLGYGAGSTGTYALGGAGMLNVGTALNVGGPGAGTGSFLHSGGSVNLGTAGQVLPIQVCNLNVGVGNGTTGTYLLADGTLNVYVGIGGVGSAAGTGTFEQTGGTHNFRGMLFVGGDVYGGNAPGTGTYRLTGGRLNVTPVEIGGGLIILDGLRLLPGGTFDGGVADGVFSGKFTQEGGTVTGVLRNEGMFVYQSGTFAGALLNRGTFNLDNGDFASPMAATNEDGGLITGAGTFAAAVTNRGTISPMGAMVASGPIDNTGVIHLGASSSLTPGQVDNVGQINLAGGALRGGAGSISNNAGGVIAGGGTIDTPILQNGGIIRADNPSVPLTLRTLPSTSNTASQLVVAPNAMMKLQGGSYTNTAMIALQGGGAQLSAATITNNGTIRGAGHVAAPVLNNATIRAEGGELHLAGAANANAASGRLIANAGATISFAAGLANNHGSIQLVGGGFDNEQAPMVNHGAIVGRGTLRAGPITNAGSMVFSGGTSEVFAPLTNQGQLTVTGNGVATFYDAVDATGSGSISVSLGSSAVFMDSFTAAGAGISGKGTKDFQGAAEVGGINADGTTIVGPVGELTAGSVRDDTVQIFGRIEQLANGTPSATSRVKTLLIAGSPDHWTGQWDLADNNLIVDYAGPTPAATIANQIKAGSNGGAWNSNGITSSSAAGSSGRTALGYAEASDLGVGNFAGQLVDATSVLVRYTLAGDANLNGTVDLTDFTYLAANFNGTGKNWLQGDYNYDGGVDLSDFTFLASNFNGSLAAADASPWSAGATVPEPAMLGLAGLAMTFVRPRGRRN